MPPKAGRVAVRCRFTPGRSCRSRRARSGGAGDTHNLAASNTPRLVNTLPINRKEARLDHAAGARCARYRFGKGLHGERTQTLQILRLSYGVLQFLISILLLVHILVLITLWYWHYR